MRYCPYTVTETTEVKSAESTKKCCLMDLYSLISKHLYSNLFFYNQLDTKKSTESTETEF